MLFRSAFARHYLADKFLFALHQLIEVGIKSLLGHIAVNLHLWEHIALPFNTPLPLFKVGRTPRTINLPGTGTGCFHGLELLHHVSTKPGIPIRKFQCPHGLELLPNNYDEILEINLFQCPHGLELLPLAVGLSADIKVVSMPSRA